MIFKKIELKTPRMVCEAESDSANALLRGGGISIILLMVSFLFFLPKIVFAQVLINEFLVNPIAGEQEWVELFNDSDETVNLADWKITDESGSNLNLSGCIISKGFRSFFHGEGWLNNTGGDIITLKNTENEEEDRVVYGSGEVIGIPGEGKSEARDPDGGTSWKLVDSPSSQNNDCSLPTSTPVPTDVPTPVPTDSPASSSYDNIFISEFMADPESGNEWVELFNDNDSEVNLNGWYLDDVSGGGKSPRGISGTISANSYKQFFLDDFFFNNSGDDVRLLDGSQTEKDKKSYSSNTKGKTWSKDSSGNWCQTAPTPGSSNPACPLPAATATPTPTKTLTLTPTPVNRLNVTPTLSQVLNEKEDELAKIMGNKAEEKPVVLGEQDSSTRAATIIRGKDKIKITAAIFIIGGLVLLGLAGFFLFKEKYDLKNNLVPQNNV